MRVERYPLPTGFDHTPWHSCFDRFNAPLEFNRRQGHHYTDPEWRLPSISLSQGELFALILGARMLQSYAGSAYAAELRSSIARLSERLPILDACRY